MAPQLPAEQLNDALRAIQAPSKVCCGAKSGFGRKVDTLRSAFLEFYRYLELVRSFAALNEEGFRKITKKHDKITGITFKSEFMVC